LQICREYYTGRDVPLQRHTGPAQTDETVAKLPEGKKVRPLCITCSTHQCIASLSLNQAAESKCHLTSQLTVKANHVKTCTLQFFLAPSLTTGKGALSNGGGLNRREIAPLDGGVPCAVLELRYETAATLML
jgi:hypothetical protein